MKSYKEIRTDIEKAFDALDKVREEEKRLTAIWTEEEDLIIRRDKRRSVLDDIADCNSKELALQMSIHIMKNNARVALWREVLPVVLEVLKKYEGKPYGEKTRAKIADEVAQRTGARAYIRTNYSQDQIDIYPHVGYGTTYNITTGPRYDGEKSTFPRLLENNRITLQPLETFALWYIKNDYIEDIPATVANMIALHKKALMMQRELAAVCSEFNTTAVDGIECIYSDKRIYERIMIK